MYMVLFPATSLTISDTYLVAVRYCLRIVSVPTSPPLPSGFNGALRFQLPVSSKLT